MMYSLSQRVLAVLTCGMIVVLGGCATLITGSKQTVQVQAIETKTHKLVSSAKCNIRNAKGLIFAVDDNPGAVTLPRDFGGLSVQCVAPGYRQAAVGTGQSFNAWTLANVLFFPGFVVDAVTGAAAKYPAYITVLMEKSHHHHGVRSSAHQGTKIQETKIA